MQPVTDHELVGYLRDNILAVRQNKINHKDAMVIVHSTTAAVRMWRQKDDHIKLMKSIGRKASFDAPVVLGASKK